MGSDFLRHGWVHPNGIIGTNAVMTKYPTVDEFAHEWASYIYNFPFLDLIIGITWWNEMSQSKWDMWHDSCMNGGFDTLDEIKYFEYDDFCDNIEAGI